MDLAEFKKNIPIHYVRKLDQERWKFIVELPEEADELVLCRWCKENCSDLYYVYNGCHVLFECIEDATGFKLEWT